MHAHGDQSTSHTVTSHGKKKKRINLHAAPQGYNAINHLNEFITKANAENEITR